MIAQVKCSYANLYYKDKQEFIKLKEKFGKRAIIGRLNGVYKTYNGRDYLQLESVEGMNQKNHLWVKKIAVNIIEEQDKEVIFIEDSSNNNKSSKNKDLILPLALIAFLIN